MMLRNIKFFLYNKHLAESTRKDLIYRPPQNQPLPHSYHPGITKINDPRFIQKLLQAQAKPLPKPKPALLMIAIFAGLIVFINWASDKLPYRPYSNNFMVITDIKDGKLINAASHPWSLAIAWLNFDGELVEYLPALAFICYNFKRYPTKNHRSFILLNGLTFITLTGLGTLLAKYMPSQQYVVWDRRDFSFGPAMVLFFLTTLSLYGSIVAQGLSLSYLTFQLYKTYTKRDSLSRSSHHASMLTAGPCMGFLYVIAAKKLM